MSLHSVVRATTITGFCLLLSQACLAQSTGTTPTRPPGNTGGTTTPPTGTTPTTNIPSTTNPSGTKQPTQTYNQTIFLTGRVLLENGSPPPEPATIERVCNGQARAEGYSDSQGNFGVQLGNENGVFQDASEEASRSAFPGAGGSGTGSNSGSVGFGSGAGGGMFSRYQNCELRAKLPGYRSQTISLANRRPLDDPNVGVILLHKDGGELGTTVSASALAAPKDARKAFERGLQDVKKNKLDDAGKDFSKAVELYPNHAEAWFELGRVQVSKGQRDAARDSFNASIKADPKFVNPYVQLAILVMADKNWQELGDLTDRGMRLDSFDYPQLFLFNGVANYNLHKFELAERSLKQAVRLDVQHRFPDIQHLMGLVLVVKKDYTAAAEQFRAYLRMAPDNADAPTVRTQLAEVEKLTTQSAVAGPKDQ